MNSAMRAIDRFLRLPTSKRGSLVLILTVLLLEFFVLRWYYTTSPIPSQKSPKGHPNAAKHHRYKPRNHRKPTAYELNVIDNVMSDVKSVMSDKDNAKAAAWPAPPSHPSQLCQYYDQVRQAKRYIINNVFGTSMPQDDNAVTVVTQCSVDRLDRVIKMAATWGGAISVATHVTPKSLPSLSQNLVTLLSSIPEHYSLALHLVFDLAQTDIYPVNFLRNVAFNASTTYRLFLVDVDFVMSRGLHDVIRRCQLGEKEAAVVPAFEIPDATSAHVVIRDTKELLRAWKRRIVHPFKMRDFPPGQRATQFQKWMNATKRYVINYEYLYEPYVLVKKTKSLPHYNEKLMNRNWDKVSHIHSLYSKAYKFVVLPKVFVLHYPHLSTAKAVNKYKNCSKVIWESLWRNKKGVELENKKHKQKHTIVHERKRRQS